MSDPIARIKLAGNATYRGAFSSAEDLRNFSFHGNFDYAQIYTLRKIYRYDSSSIATDDGSSDPAAIKPADVSTGRWLPTNAIDLHGADSDPGSGSISIYSWILVWPQNVPSPAPSLVQMTLPPPFDTLYPPGSTARLTIPTGPDWKPGGVMVFLRVENNLSSKSGQNAFDPRLNQDALFKFPVLTEKYGFSIPPAGARNWHRDYADMITTLDGQLFAIASSIPVQVSPTASDKSLTPLATSGNFSSTGISITHTPHSDSYVSVLVNGIQVEVGDGVRTKNCYFSADAGASAKTIANISASDVLFWNGVISGYDLSPTDRIDLNYVTA